MSSSDQPAAKPGILCLDDEARVLDGLKTTLRRDFTVFAETSGAAALSLLEKTPDICVAVSDMRMPAMDGAAFLSQVKRRWPDITRVLLTGEAGRAPAVAAVNDGAVFRFLTKPCAPDQLIATLKAAHRQYQLVTSEKVLLQETLLGSIQALVDILGIVNPVAFGRAGRIKRLVIGIYRALGHRDSWELEAAALLSQVGYVSLPIELVEKIYYGERLNSAEATLAGEVPQIVPQLLGRIPRLERVMAILDLAAAPLKPRVAGDPNTERAAVLAAALEFDGLLSRGQPEAAALAALRARTPPYEDRLLKSFAAFVGEAAGGSADADRQLILLREVRIGMILQDDVRTESGTLLVSKGYEVTESFLQRMRNFGESILAERVRVTPAGGSSGPSAERGVA